LPKICEYKFVLNIFGQNGDSQNHFLDLTAVEMIRQGKHKFKRWQKPTYTQTNIYTYIHTYIGVTLN
jgi:hypothetical protein